MKVYEATMRVVYTETWTVDAENEAEARKKISELTADVETGDPSGEIADWEVYAIRDATSDHQ